MPSDEIGGRHGMEFHDVDTTASAPLATSPGLTDRGLANRHADGPRRRHPYPRPC